MGEQKFHSRKENAMITLEGGKVTKKEPPTASAGGEKVGADVLKEPPGEKMAQAFHNKTGISIYDMIIEVHP